MSSLLTVWVSYHVTTPESAEHGEYAEHGFMSDASRHGMPISIDDALDCDSSLYERDLRAHDVLRLAQSLGCTFSASREGGRVRFYAAEPQDTDFASGAHTEYTLHVCGPRRLLTALIRAVSPSQVHV